jgi:hypothetical protein
VCSTQFFVTSNLCHHGNGGADVDFAPSQQHPYICICYAGQLDCYGRIIVLQSGGSKLGRRMQYTVVYISSSSRRTLVV